MTKFAQKIEPEKIRLIMGNRMKRNISCIPMIILKQMYTLVKRAKLIVMLNR